MTEPVRVRGLGAVMALVVRDRYSDGRAFTGAALSDDHRVIQWLDGRHPGISRADRNVKIRGSLAVLVRNGTLARAGRGKYRVVGSGPASKPGAVSDGFSVGQTLRVVGKVEGMSLVLEGGRLYALSPVNLSLEH